MGFLWTSWNVSKHPEALWKLIWNGPKLKWDSLVWLRHFAAFWNFVQLFETVRNWNGIPLHHFEKYWNVLKPFEMFWTVLKPLGTYIGFLYIIPKRFETFWNNDKRLWNFSILIRDSFVSIPNLLERLRNHVVPFEAVWNSRKRLKLFGS
jgi:hypothetical protein